MAGRSLFGIAVRGDLASYARADAQALAKIHTMVARKEGGRTHKGIQKQIVQMFAESSQFAAAIKLKSDPAHGYSAKAVVTVYSKALYRGKGTRRQDFDLLEIYTRPENVMAAGHTWLAFPTADVPFRQGDSVGRGGAQRRMSPHELGLPLAFIMTKKDNEAVLVTKGPHPVVMYVLLRISPRQARVTPDAIHLASVAKAPDDFATLWAKEDDILSAKFGRGVDVTLV